MIVVGGRTYYTIADAALKLGVSAKTVRDYIAKGIIPDPPTVKYGIRKIRHFPPEYMVKARGMLKEYINKRKKI